MPYPFKIIRSDAPNFIPHAKHLLPMSARSFQDCEEWLTQAIAGFPSHLQLLTRDLRHLRLAAANPGRDRFGTFISFRTLDRNARLVTPAQFCFMRLLSLPGRRCAWYFGSNTKKNLPPELRRYYLAFGNREYGKLYGLRILYDAMVSAHFPAR